MCLLLETIKVEQACLCNLPYHQKRFDAARAKFFPRAPKLDLAEVIQVPSDLGEGLHRCRVLYGEAIQQVEFIPQQARIFRSLQVVHAEINYEYKWENRAELNQILAKKGDADEVLIVKNGLITDCTIGNLVLQKAGQLFTPKECLLAGTKRQQLLDEGLLLELTIPFETIGEYESVGIINALIDLEDVSWIPISEVK
ncbi:MAG: aminotransferase class IV [Mangrovibacterium sp.]